MSLPTDLEVRQRGCCQVIDLAMPDGVAIEAAQVFKAVADPARVQILATLAASAQPACVCDLTAVLGLSQATVSHHVSKLRKAGFVAVEKHGLWSYYTINDELGELQDRVLTAVGTHRGIASA